MKSQKRIPLSEEIADADWARGLLMGDHWRSLMDHEDE